MEYIDYLVLPKLGQFEVEFKGGEKKVYTKYEDVCAVRMQPI